MVNNVFKNLIEVNQSAVSNIEIIESFINEAEIKDEKDKANFGNLCIALKGFRMIAESTEAILANDDILKGEDGNFYSKVVISKEETKVENKNPNE